jgi:small-conductance mechanosensitive channel
MTFREILEYSFLNIGNLHLTLFHVISAIFVLAFARILMALISRGMTRYFDRKKLDRGRRYAILQVLKYIVYTSAILLAMESMGISFSLLLGGAAALLVGVGLGLQQTFNDLLSGIILLIEGSVEVGDVIEIDGLVGSVTAIGLRTSKVETRDRVSLVIPNSKLVGDKSINWSHNAEPTRFHINVGVAYSSDVNLVTKLLIQAAQEHNAVLSDPGPRVQFKDFGNSSLDFTLLVFSQEYLSIEFVKSDLRYKIVQLFRENKVEIPFPQQDIWFRNAQPLSPLKS